MSYKYLDSSLGMSHDPKNRYTSDLQENINKLFKTSSNWFTIQEETVLGSFIFSNIDVRISHVIDALSGEKLGDDYKKITFQDMGHIVKRGTYYIFDNNYWMVYNVDNIKSLTPSVTVRRCNNILRWILPDYSLYSLPCVIDDSIKEYRNYASASLPVPIPSGNLQLNVQLNDKTNTIRKNQRFLFGNSGNWNAYQVAAAGMGNFDNRETSDNMSAGVLDLYLNAVMISDTDDLVNGVADSLQYSGNLILSNNSVSGIVGDIITIKSDFYINGELSDVDLLWSTSNPLIATVSQSGNITLVADGNCVVTCKLKNNTNVSSNISVSVGSTQDIYRLTMLEESNVVLENSTEIFNIYLFKNNIQQADNVNFVVYNNGFPVTNYTLTILGNNSFSIENKEKYMEKPLIITATSGSNVRNFEFILKGAW